MKNVLIVAGGCLEKWDDVRGHTNLSTGRVGVYLADALSKYNFNMYYLSGYMSKKPNNESNICEFVQFWGIEDLRDKAKMLILEKKIDIVIMAAAGSDWILDYIKDKKTDEVLEGTGKISSDIEPIVYLKKAPKILKLFKEWKPSLCVVGFKLESGNLVEKAKKRMIESNVDIMIANHSESLTDVNVEHQIITDSDEIIKAKDKKDMANRLSRLLYDKNKKDLI